LQRQGYTRFHSRSKTLFEVIQDRLRLSGAERQRVVEALESALKMVRASQYLCREIGL